MKSDLKNNVLNIPAKLYRIGELVSHTPFSRQTIHNYTIMGLIHEAKWTEGGHRLYDESVFEKLSIELDFASGFAAREDEGNVFLLDPTEGSQGQLKRISIPIKQSTIEIADDEFRCYRRRRHFSIFSRSPGWQR